MPLRVPCRLLHTWLASATCRCLQHVARPSPHITQPYQRGEKRAIGMEWLPVTGLGADAIAAMEMLRDVMVDKRKEDEAAADELAEVLANARM